MTQEQIIAKANTSPALQHQAKGYPANRYGKVPLKILMACTVQSDMPMFLQPKGGTIALQGQEYYVWCNSHGALNAILPNGEMLGIRPNECTVVEWHPEVFISETN